MIGHAETVLLSWLGLGGALLSSLSLDPVLRELVILQVAACTGCDYERVQHEAIAAGVGVPAEAAAAVADGQLDSPLLTSYAAVLRVVEELVHTHTTSEARMNLLRAQLGDRPVSSCCSSSAFISASPCLPRLLSSTPTRPPRWPSSTPPTGRSRDQRSPGTNAAAQLAPHLPRAALGATLGRGQLTRVACSSSAVANRTTANRTTDRDRACHQPARCP